MAEKTITEVLYEAVKSLFDIGLVDSKTAKIFETWYRHTPLSAFDYKTAGQLVSEERTEDLIRYMQSLEAGALG